MFCECCASYHGMKQPCSEEGQKKVLAGLEAERSETSKKLLEVMAKFENKKKVVEKEDVLDKVLDCVVGAVFGPM